jgi:hypothetical protein
LWKPPCHVGTLRALKGEQLKNPLSPHTITSVECLKEYKSRLLIVTIQHVSSYGSGTRRLSSTVRRLCVATIGTESGTRRRVYCICTCPFLQWGLCAAIDIHSQRYVFIRIVVPYRTVVELGNIQSLHLLQFTVRPCHSFVIRTIPGPTGTGQPNCLAALGRETRFRLLIPSVCLFHAIRQLESLCFAHSTQHTRPWDRKNYGR